MNKSEYINKVAEVLEKVFLMPKENTEIIMKDFAAIEDEKYWEITQHYHPLYTAAEILNIQVEYPNFDQYENRYDNLIDDWQ